MGLNNLEVIKYNNEEYYIFRFGCFFSAGVSEIEDDYGFKILISKDLSTSLLANHEGKFKSISLDEAIKNIEAVKTLNDTTNNIYHCEIMEELIVKPPIEDELDSNKN